MPARTLPSAVEAEAAVLGCVLLYPVTIHEVMARLQVSDLFLPVHREIYEAMQVLNTKGAVIEIGTVSSQMRWRGNKSEDHELVYQLTGIAQAGAHPSSLPSYIDEVFDASRRRQMIALSAQMQEQCFVESDTEALFARFEADVFAITSKRAVREEWSASVRRVIDTIGTRSQDPREILGIESGIYALDRITEGWQPGHLITVAGSPKTGKSAWAVNNCGIFAAARRNTPVLIFSFEMLKDELIERMLGASTTIPTSRLRRGLLESKEEWQGLYSSGTMLEGLPIVVLDHSLNVMQVASEIRRWRADERFFPRRSAEEEAQQPPQPGLVIVDYLQLIEESGSKNSNREREVANMSRTLKRTAQQARVPIMQLSQLNREHTKRENKRPQLSDLRESGAIAQDSNIVIFLYREAIFGDNPDKPESFKDDAEIIVAANRNGNTGTAHVKFDKPTVRYYEVVDRDP